LADCIPLEPMDGDTITCSGLDEGFSTDANNLTLTIESGATVDGTATRFTTILLVDGTDDFTGVITNLTNDGTVKGGGEAIGAGPDSIDLVNNGEITAVQGAIRIGRQFPDAGRATGGVTITNTNLIQGQAAIKVFGDLTNLGNSGMILGNTAVQAETATITNQAGGTISGQSTGLFIGSTLINAEGTLMLTNKEDGTIEGKTGVGVFTDGFATITNEGGTISGGLQGIRAEGVQITNTGDIVGGTGLSSIDTGSSTITNSQLIRGTTGTGVSQTFGDLTLGNTGTIEGLGFNAEGVLIDRGTGNITNGGTIKGTGFGIATNGGNVTIQNDAVGVIEGSRGLEVDGVLTLTNDGRVEGTSREGVFVTSAGSATIENHPLGIIRGARDGIEIDGDLTRLDNHGLVEGLNGAGVDVFGTAGTIENDGTITGTLDGIKLTTGALSLTNRGTLIGDADMNGTGAAIRASGFDDSVINTGLITGLVALRSGNDTVINGGTIDGSVFLGLGDDTFLVDLDGSTPPVVTGIIDGGEGTDRLGVATSLVKSATLTVAGGFEELAAKANGAGAELTLNPGAGAFGQTLTISGGGTIINNADFDVTGGPAIQFEPGTSDTTLRQNATLTTRGLGDAGVAMNNENTLEHGGDIVTKGEMAEGVRGGELNTITILENGTVRTEGLGATGIRVDGANDITINSLGRIVTQGEMAEGVRGGELNTITILENGTVRTEGLGATGIRVDGANDITINGLGRVDTLGPQSPGIELSGTGNRIMNAGTVASAQGPGIEVTTLSTAGLNTIRNENGGTIIGGNGVAIQGNPLADTREMVTNFEGGILTGDIQLGGGNDTVINGGTISGDVFLGFGDDTFLVDLDGNTPPVVTGNIDGGEGTDRFGVSTSLVRSATLTVRDGFEELAAEANGAGAELTLNLGAEALDQTLTISGGGTIVNNADFDVTGGSAIQFDPATPTALENHGTLIARDPLLPAVRMASNQFLFNPGRIETTGGPGVEADSSNVIEIGDFIDGGGLISTSGTAADGIVVIDKNEISILGGAMVVTQGKDALGISLEGNLNDLEVKRGAIDSGILQTSGDFAHGIAVFGNENQVNADGVLQTSGADAVGILVAGNMNAIGVSRGPENIPGVPPPGPNERLATSGVRAHGVEVQGDGNTIIVFGNRALTTSGASAHGITIHGTDNTVQLPFTFTGDFDATTIETAGAGSAGIAVHATGNTIFIENGGINAQQAPAIAVSLTEPPDARSTKISIETNGQIRGGNGVAIQGDLNAASIEEVVLGTDARRPTVVGIIELFSGDDRVSVGGVGGQVDGDVLMGMGNDTVSVGGDFGTLNFEVSGTVDGGEGLDELIISTKDPGANRIEVTIGGLSGFETRKAEAFGINDEIILNGKGSALGQGFFLQGNGLIRNNADFAVTNESVFTLDGVGLILVNNANIQSNGVAIRFGSTGGGNVLTNNGMITGSGGLAIAADDSTSDFLNNFTGGAIFGSIDLGGGPDRVINSGLINGNVWLRSGADSFLSTTSGMLTGFADGGEGTDAITFTTVEADKEILGDRYVNFEILDKRGSKKLQLGGTLSVDTGTVSEGEFVLLPESVLDLDELTVKSGATLGGTGTVTGTVIGLASSTIGPGFSPGGPLTILGDLDITAGGKLLLEIASLLSFDSFALGGDLLLGGGDIIFDLLGDLDFSTFAEDFATPADFFFVLSDPTDPTSALLPWTDLSVFEGANFFVQGGGFAGLEPLLFADAGFSFSQSNLGMDGGMNGDPGGTEPVPEPATLLLFGSGVAGLIAWRWKTRR